VQHVEDHLLALVGHHDPGVAEGVDVEPRLEATEEEEEEELVCDVIVACVSCPASTHNSYTYLFLSISCLFQTVSLRFVFIVQSLDIWIWTILYYFHLAFCFCLLFSWSTNRNFMHFCKGKLDLFIEMQSL